MILLVTDGVTDVIIDENIENIMRNKTNPQLLANEIMQTVKDRNGIDNATALAVLIA